MKKMMYRGFTFDVLDDGFCFIWYEGCFVGCALNTKYAQKRVDNIIANKGREGKRK
jgi:hypothetical protein